MAREGTAPRAGAHASGSKLQIFISYSRADLAFADALVAALERHDIEALIDRRDLNYGEEWKPELMDFVRRADAVVFIVSPRSIASSWCRWEAEQVKAESKRLVPVVLEPVPPADLPTQIADIHLLPFTDTWDAVRGASEAFRGQAATLAKVLLTDRVWIKDHTRLAELARRWETARAKHAGRAEALLLRGDALAEAELWISRRPREAPEPTDLHRAYVQEGRKAEQARAEDERARLARTRRFQRRSAWALAGVATLVMVGLVSSIIQSREAERQTAIVLTSLAQKAIDEKQYDRAIRVGLYGVPVLARLPWSLGWNEKEIRALEAKIGGAAQVSQLLLSLNVHGGSVRTAAFSPDGARVVTGSHDGTMRVWDAKSGTQLIELKGHSASVQGAAFSPDGVRIVTGSRDGTARVWESAPVPASGASGPSSAWQPVLVLKGHGGTVMSAAYSPDGGRIVTSSADRKAMVWNATSGAQLLALAGHDGYVNSAAFSPDGARIVTSSDDRTARVWDAASGAQLLELKGHGGPLYSAAFSPDGARIVTGSDDRTARVWDAASGAQLLELNGHEGSVNSATFSPDGMRLLTGSFDRTARIWNADSGAQLLTLKGHGGSIFAAAFSLDGTRIVTGSFDGTARVWDAKPGAGLVQLKGHRDAVWSAAFSADGTRVVTGSFDRTARVWDARTAAQMHMLNGHTDHVTDAAFDTDGTRIVTGSSDRTARVWEARNGMPLLVLKGHGRAVTSATFSPDGAHILTGSADRAARVWDASSGTQLVEIKRHAHAVRSASFSPDGTRILTGSDDDSALVSDARTGAPLLELKGHGGPVNSAAFSPDGARIVTGSDDGTARVWDAHWLVNVRGEELVRRVCAEKLPGATRLFTSEDTLDPTLSGLAGVNPCARVGPLSFEYWRRLSARWRPLRAVTKQ